MPGDFEAFQSSFSGAYDAPFADRGRKQPLGATEIVSSSSGNVANAPAIAGVALGLGAGPALGWIRKFRVTGAGATAAGVITITVTNLKYGTLYFNLAIPAGVLVPVDFEHEFPNALPAADVALVITVTVPAFGAGNTNACVVAEGYFL